MVCDKINTNHQETHKNPYLIMALALITDKKQTKMRWFPTRPQKKKPVLRTLSFLYSGLQNLHLGYHCHLLTEKTSLHGGTELENSNHCKAGVKNTNIVVSGVKASGRLKVGQQQY